MSARCFEGNGMKLMREFDAKYNMASFPCGNTGAKWVAGSARKSSRRQT